MKRLFFTNSVAGLVAGLVMSLCLAAQDVRAEVFPTNKIYHGETLNESSLEEALSRIEPGSVVVLGEHHGTMDQASQQMQIIEKIKENGRFASVGMEFFEYPYQAQVDAYRAGELGEGDFLAAVGWGKGFPYTAYRQQVLSPRLGSEYVVALNAPRSVTGKIARLGYGSLTEAEKAMLPPGFTRGNPGYFERFKRTMNHLFVGAPGDGADKMENYFTAQSAWDDTMAYNAINFLQAHPEQILVIIVGEFHVQYGGGLPDRIRARGLNKVTTFSLVDLEGLTEKEEKEAVEVSKEWGARASYIWTSRIGG